MSTIHVRSVAGRAVLLTLSVLFSVSVAASDGGPEGTVAVYVKRGWNLLSLPAAVVDGSVSTLFPGAWSQAYGFGYDPYGYHSINPLYPGPGFWMKFPDPDTIYIQGDPVYSLTIPVHEGWNIVGCLAVPVPVASVTTDPPGIRSSDFLAFVQGIGFPPVFGLMPGQGYWVQMSGAGSIILSSTMSQPCPGVPTVDWGGKTYNTVLVGDRCWLKENLDYGVRIDGSQPQTNTGTVEKYCYNDDPVNCDTYGGLYQWGEAMQYATGPRGICPEGWHIPTAMELDFDLRNAVGGDGNALKRGDQGVEGGLGTNTSGFSALLGGFRTTAGGFSAFGDNGNFWSSTQQGGTDADVMRLRSWDASLLTAPLSQQYGLSVRCIKD